MARKKSSAKRTDRDVTPVFFATHNVVSIVKQDRSACFQVQATLVSGR